MSNTPWKASSDVRDLASYLINKNHSHLENANIAIGFLDNKVFVKERFNWGKVSKFSPLAKLWQAKGQIYDFSVLLCADAWHKFLTAEQREALLDLNLSRCQVTYEPVVIVEDGKKIISKDEWGRIDYTNEVKLNDLGEPIWKVVPLGIDVFAQNIKRYGLWCEDLLNLKSAIEKS